jgi:hypothetical protein
MVGQCGAAIGRLPRASRWVAEDCEGECALGGDALGVAGLLERWWPAAGAGNCGLGEGGAPPCPWAARPVMRVPQTVMLPAEGSVEAGSPAASLLLLAEMLYVVREAHGLSSKATGDMSRRPPLISTGSLTDT